MRRFFGYCLIFVFYFFIGLSISIFNGEWIKEFGGEEK